MVRCSIGNGEARLSPTRTQVKVYGVDAGTSRAKRRLFLMVLSVFASFAVTFAWSSPARAADFSATQMKVSVWPEYDDPRVLIINSADVDPALTLPAEVSFNIPKGAEIGMACEVDSGGGHNCKTYQLADKGDYQTLTYTVEKEHKIFLEYYYVAFAAGSAARSFDFTFRPSFAVTSFDLEVQEPLRSTGFTVDPALPQATTDSQGLTYHTKNLGSLSVGQPLDVKVSYTKADNNPSVEKADNASGSGATSASAGGGGRNTAIYAVLGVLAFGGVLFGSYKKLRPAVGRASRSGRRPSKAQYSNRQPAARRGVVAKSQGAAAGGPKKRRDSADDLKYCTSCGSELQRKHRFCPECGSEQS